MRIVCVGGGPAGLYLAILAKLREPARDVVVLERDPPGVTYGWGVVFSQELLNDLWLHDPVSAAEVEHAAATWTDQLVGLSGRTVHLGGYGYSIGRQRLLDVLGRRATQLGVDVRYATPVQWPLVGEDEDLLAGADLVVAGDGVNSTTREHAGFAAEARSGADRYAWLGTTQRFDAFTFGFERTRAGWIWFHAYTFDADTSTFIVECAPQTWAGLGLDRLDPAEGTALLEQIFTRYLDGHPLIDQVGAAGRTPWLSFTRVSNPTWVRGNVALMGDAAHTTHFSIGSGTTLAVRDAIALADQLDRHSRLPDALDAYDRQRRHEMAGWQLAADNSARWFEQVDRHASLHPLRFGYAMVRRRHGEQPPAEPLRWRLLVYLASQVAPLRAARLAISRYRRQRVSTARPAGQVTVASE